MSKYSGKAATTRNARTARTAPIQTTDQTTRTYNGDLAYVRDAKSDLFTLAVNFMGEQESTYYETGNARQERFVALIHQVTAEDPAWMQHFIPFLRNDAFMRTASIVAAAEYLKARGPNAAAVIDSAVKRADEPGEVLGYWLLKYGRSLPMALKRGLARAERRVFTEFNALKYDTATHGVRFGDVIELTHPKPVAAWQSTLFAYLLDRRHHADSIDRDLTFDLPMISENRRLRSSKVASRREYVRAHPEVVAQSGLTWESLSEWLPGGMDAEAWEWMIPNMGYMALLRNLRNFDQAGVSDTIADQVIAKLTDPEQVAKSMQFPFRFYNAYKHTDSTRWARALDQALDLSCSNVPKLSGRSLVLVDISGSMGSTVSNKSTLQRAEAAALFGTAQFRAAGFSGDLVVFASGNKKIPLAKGTSVLKGTETVVKAIGSIGYGTEMWPALEQHYDGHDRVFLFTDEQANRHYGSRESRVPIYFWNLAGYAPAATEFGKNGRYEMAGLSDATFRQIALIEQSKNAQWPW